MSIHLLCIVNLFSSNRTASCRAFPLFTGRRLAGRRSGNRKAGCWTLAKPWAKLFDMTINVVLVTWVKVNWGVWIFIILDSWLKPIAKSLSLLQQPIKLKANKIFVERLLALNIRRFQLIVSWVMRQFHRATGPGVRVRVREAYLEVRVHYSPALIKPVGVESIKPLNLDPSQKN